MSFAGMSDSKSTLNLLSFCFLITLKNLTKLAIKEG